MGRRVHPFAIACIVLSILLPLGFEPLRAEWIVNGMPICTGLNDQENEVVLSDGHGGAFIVWRDTHNSPPLRYFAQKIGLEGGIHWQVDGKQISPGDVFWNFPRFIADGEGGILAAYFVYSEEDHTISTTYVQKVDEEGLAQWPDSGISA